MRYIIFSIALSLVLLSCKKDKLDVGPYYHCHNSQNLDSTAMSNKLAGSWKLKKQFCFWTNETTTPAKTIKLTFNSDATYTLMENAVVITQGNWEINNVGSNDWRLDTAPWIEYSYGAVLLCNDQLVFSGSGADGCDYLFDRTN